MKKLTLMVVAILFTINLKAQDYQQTMLVGIIKMDSAKSIEQWQDAANYFERIAAADTTIWLPQYYAAYTNIMLGVFQEKNKTKDAFYNKASGYLSIIEGMNIKNDEILILKSFMLQMQIAVNPMKRGKELGEQSDKLLEEAFVMNPENPRYFLLKAENLWYTPSMFGGDKLKACEFYQIAKEKFEVFKLKENISPNWGLFRINDMLLECSKQKK